MIKELFSLVLNMSITASVVIAAVISVRFMLKKQPKIYSYVLWSVVLFRLLCPWSFSTSFSAFNAVPPAVVNEGQIVYELPQTADNFTAENDIIITPQKNIIVLNEKTVDWDMAISAVWLIGTMYIAACNMVYMSELKNTLAQSEKYYGNIYICPEISTAFAAGIFRTKIYLPANLTTEQKNHILLHENTHLHRKDNIFKFLAFCALCIHWFNPLVWIAFRLSERDMEMSCDEAVIRKMNAENKYDYSRTLLSLSCGNQKGTQLAFGEGDVKGRIMNILNYKKPSVKFTVVIALVMALTVTAFAANPMNTDTAIAGTDTESEPQTVKYTVEPGDTVWGIAEKHGMDIRELYELNNIENGSYLQPGDELIVNNAGETDERIFYLKSDEAEMFMGQAVAVNFKKNYNADAEFISTYAYPAEAENGYSVDMYYTETSEDGKKLNSYFTVLSVKETEPGNGRWTIDGYTEPDLVGTSDADLYTTAPSDASEPDISSDKFVWPTALGRISRGFTGQYPENHNGIDIAAPTGTEIYAAESGTVTKALYTSVGNGIYTVIDHGDYTTLYSHCSELLVKMGQTVEKGDVIALVGSTGNSTGPHLHFGVYNKATESYENPYNFF